MWGPPRIVVIVTALAACASAFTPPLSLGLSVAPRASSRPLTLRMVASADIELWEAGFAVVPSTQVPFTTHTHARARARARAQTHWCVCVFVLTWSALACVCVYVCMCGRASKIHTHTYTHCW